MTIHLLQALTDGMFWLDRRTCARIVFLGVKEYVARRRCFSGGQGRLGWGWGYIPVVAAERLCVGWLVLEIIFGIERSQGRTLPLQGGNKKYESTGVNAAIETQIAGSPGSERGGRAVPERKVNERT